ncbi:MAG: type II toxin-antitoxin system VapC family toxin, partial [Gemmatimonadaceae bacterium]|nr:type II toxin-antitoxin system VapC family toxin [Gemmatimonadaceae bacterium]
MIVADVNLIAFLLLGGSEQPLAQQVLERDPQWAAPLLWRSEFRSVLAAYMRQRGLGLSDARRAYGLADELLAGREYAVPSDRVLELVADSDCSAYDCEYVALARELGIPVVTADRQLLRAFPAFSVNP